MQAEFLYWSIPESLPDHGFWGLAPGQLSSLISYASPLPQCAPSITGNLTIHKHAKLYTNPWAFVLAIPFSWNAPSTGSKSILTLMLIVSS